MIGGGDSCALELIVELEALIGFSTKYVSPFTSFKEEDGLCLLLTTIIFSHHSHVLLFDHLSISMVDIPVPEPSGAKARPSKEAGARGPWAAPWLATGGPMKMVNGTGFSTASR